MKAATWLAVALVAWLGPKPAAAQETTFTYESRVDPADRLPEMPILVKGTVMAIDRQTSLDYTNVFVEGARFGTMALQDGQFWLRGLSPGTHVVKASYISYEVGEVELTLEPGDIVVVEFWLDQKPVEFDPFLVQAERRTIILEETGTARRLGASDIENLPIDNVEELVALQPGVVLQDNAIHIRGGREDDTQFFVDGLATKDPLSAGRYGVSFNSDLINEIEVLTGGFSAEYGQAVSGVVNVSTREGSDRFEGKVTYKTDSVAPEESFYNTDNVRVLLSGPNLLWEGLKASGLSLPGDQYLLVSGSTNLTDTYLPTESLDRLHSPLFRDDFWTPRADNSWSGLGKLTWKFDPSQKLNFTYNYQQDISLGFFLPSEGYPVKYQNILDTYNVFSSQSILGQLVWNHVMGEDRFYELVVGRQFNRLHSNKNGDDSLDAYSGWERGFEDSLQGPVYYGAHLSGDLDRWHDHFTETWTIKGDYTWMAKEINQLKAGIEYNWTEMQLVDLKNNVGQTIGQLALNEDVFFAHPQLASAYFQDRLTYNGLIMNMGVRLDGWAPGPEVDDVISRPDDFVFIFPETRDSYYDKTYNVFGRRWKAKVSPRLGLSFPISSRDKFFFNYGHFSQWPRYNYVYSQLQTDFATGLSLVGNPDLDPKVTVQYETGIQHEFENLWSGEITFYSNDIYDYAQAIRQGDVTIDPALTPDPDDFQPATSSPVRYFNADAARTIGLEFLLRKRTTKWLSGSLAVEFQQSRGTNSDANANFLNAQINDADPDRRTEGSIRNNPLEWDRPWSVTLNLDFSVEDDRRPELFGWTMPKNWSTNLLYRAWAGQRYTDIFLISPGASNESPDKNGKVGPYRSSLDLKFSKWINLSRNQRFTVFFEGRNLLDHLNYRRVNRWTGQGYHRGNWDGDLAVSRENGDLRSADSQLYVQDNVNPSHLSEPRIIMMGASYQW